MDATVYFAGIICEGEQTYAAVHVRGVRRVLEAMAAADVRRIVHVSALGARPDAPGRYHASMAEGQAWVRASGIDWTIFRPGLIFGEGDAFFGGSSGTWCACRFPLFPSSTGAAALSFHLGGRRR